MMPYPDFLPETLNMHVNKHFALSSELISELLLEMRLRGVQYRRLQTGSEFGVGFSNRPGHAYFHYIAVGTALLRTHDGTLYELKAGSMVFMPQGGVGRIVPGLRVGISLHLIILSCRIILPYC